MAGVLGVTAILVLAPLALVLVSSVKPADALPWDPLPPTLANFAEVFGSTGTYSLLASTGIYAAASLTIGLALACALSWLTERTDMPGGNVVFALAVVSIGLPPILTAFGWSLWLSPRIGFANILLRQALGSAADEGPLNGYSLGGMVFVTGLTITPSMFLMLSALFRAMDPALEEAGAMSGARQSTIWRRLTLPLLLPGLLAAAMYYAVALIQAFDIPLALGLPGRTFVLSTRIYLLTRPQNSVPQYGLASTFALLAMIVGGVLMAAYISVTRQAERFRTVAGKGYRPRRVELGVWRGPAAAAAGLYFLLSIGAPLSLLLWASLLPTYQAPSRRSFGGLTLAAYRVVLSNPRVLPAILNTIVLMITAASAAILLSLLVAWLSVRSRGASGRVLQSLAFLPLAIPSTVTALAVVLLYLRTPIYGTIWILAIGQVTAFLAFGTRTMTAAVTQLDRELEESAAVHGAASMTTLRRVVGPLLSPAAANGWVWVAMHSVRDFTFPLMMGTAGSTVLAALIWSLWTIPDIPSAAALSILIAVTLGGLAGVGRAYAGARAGQP
jgi:iron(III) transport system permease protein